MVLNTRKVYNMKMENVSGQISHWDPVQVTQVSCCSAGFPRSQNTDHKILITKYCEYWFGGNKQVSEFAKNQNL